MQPCSQPRKALTERSKPMSGELLRVRIDFGCSIVTVVRRFGTPSSASTSSSHSPSVARSLRLKRVGVALRVAPRPWFDSTGIVGIYAANRNITRTLSLFDVLLQALERIAPLLRDPDEKSFGFGQTFLLDAEADLAAEARRTD